MIPKLTNNQHSTLFNNNQHLLSHTVPLGQEIGSGLARWSWLRVSHEIALRISDGAAVT